MSAAEASGLRFSVLGVLIASCAVTQFFRSFLPVLSTSLYRELGLSSSDLAFVSSVWFLAFAATQIPAGMLLDRIGARQTVAIFTASLSGSCVLFASSGGFASLCLAAALMGACCAPVFTGTLVFVGDRVTPERFSFLSGLVLAVSTLGAIGAGAPLAQTIALVGWRLAVAGIGVLTLALSVALFLLGRDDDRERHDSSGKTMPPAGFGAVVLNRQFLRLLTFAFVSSAPVTAIRSLWVGPYMSELFGTSVADRGQIVSALVLAVTLASFGYAWVANLTRKRMEVIVTGSVITAALLGILAWGPVSSEGTAVVVLIAVCLFGSTYGLMMVEAKSLLPQGFAGRGVTTVTLVSFVGVSVSQGISGAAVHWLSTAGISPGTQFKILFAGFGGALLGGTLVLILNLRRMYK